MKVKGGPRTAVIAVTLNCNARCVMCDIWKEPVEGEMAPGEYATLPDSLRDINVSGGEPFLRDDLPEIIAVLRSTCPRARLVISSHGFMTDKIARLLPPILKTAPDIGLRVSLDAIGEEHDAIRGVPGGFERARATLDLARSLGVRDLGIGVTILEQNLHALRPLYEFTREHGLVFSTTVATDSPIYFGPGKSQLRPTDIGRLRDALNPIIRREFRRARPKAWIRGWFESRLVEYLASGTRPLPCDAGEGFFYLDSHATVHACHVRSLRMGSLREHNFDDIWHGPDASAARKEAGACHACWMVCTAKTQIRHRAGRIALRTLAEKARAHVR